MNNGKNVLDKFTSYEGISSATDDPRHELIDDLYQQYTEEFGHAVLGVTVISFREYLERCIQTFQWRIDTDIPGKRKLTSTIIEVPTINKPTNEDLDAAKGLCKICIEIIKGYLTKGDSVIISDES